MNSKKMFLFALLAAIFAFFCSSLQAAESALDEGRCWKILGDALKSDDVDTRRSTAVMLWTLPPEKSLPLLKEALSDRNDWVVSGALYSLGRMKGEGIKPLVEKALKSSSEEIQGEAIQVIGEAGLLSELLALKKIYAEKQGLLKLYAAASMALLGDQSGLPYIRAAADSPDLPLRREAVFFLGRLKDNESLMKIQKALDDTDKETSRRALLAMGYFSRKEMIPVFVQALKSDDHEFRGAAVMGLGRLNDERARLAIEGVLTDPDWRVRNDLVELLSGAGDEALPIIRKTLEDNHYMVRFKAAVVLVKKGQPDAMTVLMEGLGDSDEMVRKFAARALGQVGDKDTISKLTPLLEDESQIVRPEAAWAILQIVNKKENTK